MEPLYNMHYDRHRLILVPEVAPKTAQPIPDFCLAHHYSKDYRYQADEAESAHREQQAQISANILLPL